MKLTDLDALDAEEAQKLENEGYESTYDLGGANPSDVAQIEGFDRRRAREVIGEARTADTAGAAAARGPETLGGRENQPEAERIDVQEGYRPDFDNGAAVRDAVEAELERQQDREGGGNTEEALQGFLDKFDQSGDDAEGFTKRELDAARRAVQRQKRQQENEGPETADSGLRSALVEINRVRQEGYE